MPVPDRRRAGEYAAKGVAVVRRGLRLADEQVAARRLGPFPPGSPDGPRVLFLTPRSWAYHVQVEAVLARALALRGARVQMATCSGDLELCDRTNAWEAPPLPCRSCTGYVRPSLGAHDVPWEVLPVLDDDGWPELDLVSAGDLGEVEAEGLPLGRLVDIPTRWFLLRSETAGDPLWPTTARAMLRSGRRVARAVRTLLDERRPDVVVLLNGLFFFESITREIALEAGIDVVTYERGFRPGSLVFRRDVPASRYDIGPAWEEWRDVPLTGEEEDRLDDELAGRQAKGHPIFDFWRDATHERPERRRPGRQVALFTNVTWDSAVLGRDQSYESVQRWVDATVEHLARRPDDELIIRVHPAESRMSGKVTREPVVDHLADRFPSLPDNVSIMGPDDPRSSYPLMESCDLGLVMSSTVGLEMALMGKPVLTAGDTHYRGRGFTVDAHDAAGYLAALDRLLEDPAEGAPDIEAARRYAYTFFFRVPVGLRAVVEPVPGLASIAVRSDDDLLPGRDPDLDRLCDGILAGVEVPMPGSLGRAGGR